MLAMTRARDSLVRALAAERVGDTPGHAVIDEIVEAIAAIGTLRRPAVEFGSIRPAAEWCSRAMPCRSRRSP
jgi:hypothetical protein